MSLWLDMLGAEIRFVDTPSYGRVRVAEAGRSNQETIIFQHGLNGHLEAYAKNIVELSDQFHIIAFDYVGHGLSEKQDREYTPVVLAEQLGELMDAIGVKKAHLSGESLGGWVSAIFAARYPEKVERLMLNTAGGLPIVSEKGKADLRNFIELTKANVHNVPTYETVSKRMSWLMHESNHHLLNKELIDLRLRIYLQPESRAVAENVMQIIVRHDEFLIPLDEVKAPTLFLWTRDNPIHDLESAEVASKRIPGSQLYVMKGDAAHWPQYEVPEEFNEVARSFFGSGKV